MRVREETRELFICECNREVECEVNGCNEFRVVDDMWDSRFCDAHTDEAWAEEEAEMQVERHLEARAFESEEMNR